MITHALDDEAVSMSRYLFLVGTRAYSNAHFGAGSGPIFLDDVQCTSTSSQLLECPSEPILSHNCLHSADAGVGCEGASTLHLSSNLVQQSQVSAASSLHKNVYSN